MEKGPVVIDIKVKFLVIAISSLIGIESQQKPMQRISRGLDGKIFKQRICYGLPKFRQAAMGWKSAELLWAMRGYE